MQRKLKINCESQFSILNQLSVEESNWKEKNKWKKNSGQPRLPNDLGNKIRITQ
jgi:hypothetical protein